MSDLKRVIMRETATNVVIYDEELRLLWNLSKDGYPSAPPAPIRIILESSDGFVTQTTTLDVQEARP